MNYAKIIFTVVIAVAFVCVIVFLIALKKKKGFDAGLTLGTFLLGIVFAVLLSIFVTPETQKEVLEFISPGITHKSENEFNNVDSVDVSAIIGTNGNVYSKEEVPNDTITEWVIRNRNDVIFKSDIFHVQLFVRKIGTKEWGKELDAEVGETFEFQVEFRNTTEDIAQNVMAKLFLPTNMEYVPDSTKLFDSNYTEGVMVADNTIHIDGINIGDYLKYGNAYIRFKAVVKDKTLIPGKNLLKTYVSFTVNGEALSDGVGLYVQK